MWPPQMYVEPDKVKSFAERFFAVETNERIAHEKDWKYRAHSVTVVKHLHLLKLFFARSIGFDPLKLQRELNAYDSVIKLYSIVSAVDPIIVDPGTTLSEIMGSSYKIIKWGVLSPEASRRIRMGSGHLSIVDTINAIICSMSFRMFVWLLTLSMASEKEPLQPQLL